MFYAVFIYAFILCVCVYVGATVVIVAEPLLVNTYLYHIVSHERTQYSQSMG